MKKYQFILTVLLSLGFNGTFAQNNPTTLENNQTAKDIFANGIVYRGLLPCADCEGIKVLLKFDENSTFSQNSLYLAKEVESFIEDGKYEIKGDTITTTDTSGETHSYLFDGGMLKMLDADGKIVSGELAPHYNLFPLDKKYYKSYYKQFIKNLGKEDQLQSMVINYTDQINVIFYRSLKDFSTKCFFEGVGKFADGILYATNDRNQTIALNIVDDSTIYIKEQLLPGKEKKICQHGTMDGLYDNSVEISNLITKDSVGFINKFIPVSEMKKNIPQEQLEKVQDGNITAFIVKSQDKQPLFSFIAEDNQMRFVQILSNNYQTPQGISLKNTFGDLKSKMTIDNIKIVGKEVYVHCMDFDMVVVFKKEDLTDRRAHEFTLESIKDSAQILKIILQW